MMPAAWMKGHLSYHGPSEPDEYEVECYAGSDPPDNQPGWTPLYAKEEWCPIETAPPEEEVLVWLRGNRTDHFNERAMVCKHDGYSGWCFPGIGGLKASHWMPAPSAPSEAVKQDG